MEELLAQRGIEVSYETIRCWTVKFGPVIAANLRRRRSPPTGRWHLDEMVVKIGRRKMWLWRAVVDEGEVLDMLVQKHRNTAATFKLLRRSLKNQGIRPETVTTDGLAFYRSALKKLGMRDRHQPGGMGQNNPGGKQPPDDPKAGAETTEVQVLGFRSALSHATVYNTINLQPHLISRPGLRTLRAQAHQAWNAATQAA